MNFIPGHLLAGVSNAHLTYVPETDEARLLFSAAKGDLEGVKQSVEAGVDIEIFDRYGNIEALFTKCYVLTGQTPLQYACGKDQPQVAEYLLEQAKKAGRVIVYNAENGMSPLTLAICANSQKCIEVLLRNGTDIRKFHPVLRSNESRNFRFMDHHIQFNPFMFAIDRQKDKAVEQMLYFTGKEEAEKNLRPKLLPFMPLELSNIVLGYHIGNSSEFLNGSKAMHPLKLATYHASKKPYEEAPKRIVSLLLEAGADPLQQYVPKKVARKASSQIAEPPAKKQKKQ